jgi:SAM-dependent methyltransferase
VRNSQLWKPTKFTKSESDWVPSTNPAHLSAASNVTAERAITAYEAAIRSHASGHLLDLGCGKTPLYGIYRDFSTSVTTTDWPSSPHDSLHVDIYADLNQPLPFLDGSFDTVLSTSVLEHIWRHDILWSEMSRLLSHGGKLILATPFMYWLHEEPHDYLRWTRYALARACHENRLEVEHLHHFGSALDTLGDIFIKMASRNATAGKLARAIIAPVLRTRWARSYASSRNERLPLGYVLVARKGRMEKAF